MRKNDLGFKFNHNCRIVDDGDSLYARSLKIVNHTFPWMKNDRRGIINLRLVPRTREIKPRAAHNVSVSYSAKTINATRSLRLGLSSPVYKLEA